MFNPFYIAVFVGIVIFLEFLFTLYLDLRNIKSVQTNKGIIPEKLENFVSSETQEKSEKYTIEKTKFGILSHCFDLIFSYIILFSGILPAIYYFILHYGFSEIWSGILFIAALGVLSFIFQIPFQLYSNFVIEEKYGFNKLTFKLWLTDLLKGSVLGVLIGVPVLYGIFYFMTATGTFWWIYVVCFLTFFQFLMLWIYPVLIAPLFNKFTPIEDKQLEEKIVSLAKKIDFPMSKIFVVDGSKRSGHSNAYFTGFGKNKRIVLYDTLMDKVDQNQVLSILGHEMGHYKLKHIRKMLTMNILGSFLTFYILGQLIDFTPLYQAFGFIEPAKAVGLQLFFLVSGSFSFFLSPLFSVLSRKHEYEADEFAIRNVANPEALKTALIHLNKENLSNLHPDPVYSKWYYSHPTLLERLNAIDKLAIN